MIHNDTKCLLLRADTFRFRWRLPLEYARYSTLPNCVDIDGTSTWLQAAHFELDHGRAFFYRAYLQQSHLKTRDEGTALAKVASRVTGS